LQKKEAATAAAFSSPGDCAIPKPKRNASDFLIGEFNRRGKLGGQGADIALITSGPLAGALEMVNADSNEIVIFRL